MAKNYINYFLVAFIISSCSIPLIIFISKKFNLYDRIDERKIHNGNISRLGGLGICFGFFIPFIVILNSYTVSFNFILYSIALSIAFIIGFIDDVYALKARYKLLLQICVGVIVCASGLIITELHFGDMISINFGLLSFPITVLWIVMFMNAINLLDGMDGLASGIVFIANIFIIIISLDKGLTAPTIISFLIAGAIFGFYLYNIPPARIFMGDGGAYLLGFIYATLPLMGMQKAPVLTLFLVPLILLLVPLGDILQVMLKRLRLGYNIFIADKNHLHHRLMRIGLSVGRIDFVLYIFTFILGFTGLIMDRIETEYAYLLFIIIFLLTMWSMFLLNSMEQVTHYEKPLEDNHRKFLRIYSNNSIKVKSLGQSVDFSNAISFDVSPVGLSFTSKLEFPKGQVIVITYNISEKKKIHMRSVVVWTRSMSGISFLTGVAILNIDHAGTFMTDYYKKIRNHNNDKLFKSM
ncbi:MAG TPA: MraY family glycosyltransferase [Spirochaetota bacterium]|mgnify:FL=1|nr:MraY family glycosyltransferase [Spirochaetota bacterium]HPR47781.1 MraY family glycosyltransferase [Spirochaetota bacterium]